MTLLQHHVLAEQLTSATTAILGLFVFIKNPKRSLNRVFFLYSLSIAGWSLLESLYISVSNPILSRHLQISEIAPLSFVGTLFLHFTYVLSAEPLSKLQQRLLKLAYCLSGFFSILGILAPHLIIKGLRTFYYLPFFADPGPLFSAWALFFLVVTLLGNVQLVTLYRQSKGEERNRLKYFVWSTVAGYIGGTPDWLLAYRIYIPALNPFGLYAVPFYAIVTSYAILQHRLFDINWAIRKSLVYSLLVTLLTVGYFSLVYGIERAFQLAFGYQSVWLSLFAFALMALFFQPLKVVIQNLVDWLVFRAPQHELVRRLEKLEGEARKTEKLKAVTTLAAGLCHELRNPLQTIRTHAEVLPERYDDPAFRKRCAEVMRTEIGRIDEFLKQLMEFAQPRQPAFRQVELHKILDSTLDLMSNEFMKRRIQLDRQYQANGARLHGDPDQLRQVILNLILNALEAIGQEGKIFVKTSQKNGWLILEVADTGLGIDPKILPKLFEPFTTTKPDGNGLGLSIVHSIVREHRGNISAQSRPGQNTTFTITLPVS